ncbi:mevalonate kinase-like isoform X2 [Pomacea canaliculata]|uniref:mevalonate kinase-like isoform X2 n=1 Tax=Pomacea canaliculata TaxID=400727 RepID=UPI000D734E6C|nr:mevalonate kinase-like isoform X2 [Pomacea canaliculata]
MDETIISAPGKVILHGEHAVVYGKTAVASSLNLRCFVRALPSEDGCINLDLPDVFLQRQWTVKSVQDNLLPRLVQNDGIVSPEPASEDELEILKEFAKIPKDSTATTSELAVIAFLYLYCKVFCSSSKRTLPAFRLRMISELPVGAGLGSSAAFSVCLAAVLLQWSGQISCKSPQHLPREDYRGDTAMSGSLGWSRDEQLLINKWAFLGEKIIHGQPSGIDNSISTLGGAISFQNKIIETVQKMPKLRILLTNTKVPRSTKLLVAGVRKRHEKHTLVMEHMLEAIEGIAQQSLRVFAALSDKPYDTEAYAELEELIDINQSLLNGTGVGHTSLDKIVALTARYNLHTKLTGAGGGGCTYTLIKPGADEDDIKNVKKELELEGFQCWETCVGSAGVAYHPTGHSDPTVPQQLFES